MWLRVGLRPLSSRPDPSLSGLGRGHRLHRSVVAASPPPFSRAIVPSTQQVNGADSRQILSFLLGIRWRWKVVRVYTLIFFLKFAAYPFINVFNPNPVLA